MMFLMPANVTTWQGGFLGLFVLLESAALSFGVVARHTPAGKEGLILSVLFLFLVLSTFFVRLHVR
jgi:hypothetical protein